jgi:4-amino-4-deoxy-L-arabinose transferase-like glycosyltransferase
VRVAAWKSSGKSIELGLADFFFFSRSGSVLLSWFSVLSSISLLAAPAWWAAAWQSSDARGLDRRRYGLGFVVVGQQRTRPAFGSLWCGSDQRTTSSGLSCSGGASVVVEGTVK